MNKHTGLEFTAAQGKQWCPTACWDISVCVCVCVFVCVCAQTNYKLQVNRTWCATVFAVSMFMEMCGCVYWHFKLFASMYSVVKAIQHILL